MALLPPRRNNDEEQPSIREAMKARARPAPQVSSRGGVGPAGVAPSRGPNTAAPAATAGSSGGQFGRYISLGEYMGQNQQQANRMAERVNSSVQQEGAKSQGNIGKLETTYNNRLNNYRQNPDSRDPGRGLQANNPKQYEKVQSEAGLAEQRANSLGSQEGVGMQVQQAYNATASRPGENRWDSALTQQAGGSKFAETQGRYGNLQQMLADAGDRSVNAYDANQGLMSQDAAAKEAADKARIEANKAKAEAERKNQEQKIKDRAAEIRAEDERRQQESRIRGYETTIVSREEMASNNGMTLEEWVAAGEPEL